MSSCQLVCPHCEAINRIPTQRLGDLPKCGRCHKSLFTAKPLELDAARFNRVIQHSQIPVVVDFWAPWCGPCKMMAPAFSEAASYLEPRCVLVKVNTEIEQSLAAQWNIRSIPTLAVIKNGVEVTRQAGAMDSRSIVQWASSHI